MGETSKEANRLAQQLWRARHPETKRQVDRDWRARNPELVNACQSRSKESRKAYSQKRYAEMVASGICAQCQRAPARTQSIVCQECQDKTLWHARKRKYGIDKETFQSMFAEQEGRCAICSVGIEERDAHVDHDHQTNRVRGLLCGSCNRGIGMFRDNPDTLDAAGAYLRERAE